MRCGIHGSAAGREIVSVGEHSVLEDRLGAARSQSVNNRSLLREGGGDQQQHKQTTESTLARLWQKNGNTTLTLHQLAAVHLSALKLHGHDMSERLVQELNGDAEVGHFAISLVLVRTRRTGRGRGGVWGSGSGVERASRAFCVGSEEAERK